MKTFRTSIAIGAIAFATVLGASVPAIAGGASNISAMHSTVIHTKVKTKTITCYKGTKTKKVTAVKPVCPKGWSTKKPVVVDAFNVPISGTISILWNQSGPSTASVTGKGSGTDFTLTGVKGNGSANATSTTDPINGTGTLTGTAGTLNLKIATGSTATAAGDSAPTLVQITGTATIVSGTGTFAGATGTLKVTGSFNIQSTSGSESDSFNALLKGNVTLK